MTIRMQLTAGFAAIALLGASTAAMAQATGKENNATTGSETGVGPKSGADVKGSTGSMQNGANGPGPSSGSMEMKNDQPTSAGTRDEQSKDLRGHSETPTTGK